MTGQDATWLTPFDVLLVDPPDGLDSDLVDDTLTLLANWDGWRTSSIAPSTAAAAAYYVASIQRDADRQAHTFERLTQQEVATTFGTSTASIRKTYRDVGEANALTGF